MISGIHAGMPLLFRETCLEEPLLEDFGPDFLERQGADFFLSWWWGGDAYLDRGRKVGSSKKHICKKGEAFSRGGANRKAGIHTGSISGMGGLSAWTVTEGKDKRPFGREGESAGMTEENRRPHREEKDRSENPKGVFGKISGFGGRVSMRRTNRFWNCAHRRSGLGSSNFGSRVQHTRNDRMSRAVAEIIDLMGEIGSGSSPEKNRHAGN